MYTKKFPSKVHFRKFTLNNLNFKEVSSYKKPNLKNINKIEIPLDEKNITEDEHLLSEFNRFLLKYKAYYALDFTADMIDFD